LFAQGDTRVQTLVNGLSGSKVIPVADTNAAADQPIDGAMAAQYSGYAFTDVRKIEGEEFKGDLKLNAILTGDVVGKYLTDEAKARLGGDYGKFDYELGAGDDTFDLALSAENLAFVGAATREGFALTISGGDGKDAISTAIFEPAGAVYGKWDGANAADGTKLADAENGNAGWYVHASQKEDRLVIDAGEGNDVVKTFGSGNWQIKLGVGNDTYYADNTGRDATLNGTADTGVDGSTGRATWVFNTAEQRSGAGYENVAARNFEALVTSKDDGDYIDLVAGTKLGGLYGLEVRVEFVDAGTGKHVSEAVKVAQGKYVVTERDINLAIQKAINDPDGVLSKLLVAGDGPGETLIVTALSDGAHVVSDLNVQFMIPTDAKINATGTGLGTFSDWKSVVDSKGVVTAWTDAAAANAAIGDAFEALTGFATFAFDTWTSSVTSAATRDYAAAFANNGKADPNDLDLTGANSGEVSDNVIHVAGATKDNDVIVLSTGANSNDVIKWDGTFGNSGYVKVVNFDTSPVVYTIDMGTFSGYAAQAVTYNLQGLEGDGTTAALSAGTIAAFITALGSEFTGRWTVAAVGTTGFTITAASTTEVFRGDGIDPTAVWFDGAGVGSPANPVIPASVTAGLGDDFLDFSEYNAKYVIAGTRDETGKLLAASTTWADAASADASMAVGNYADEEKYITLTHEAGSTEYLIELWQVNGGTGGASAYTIGADDTKLGTIGYIDLGRAIGAGTGLDGVLDHVLLG
jgi:hypothetical protein